MALQPGGSQQPASWRSLALAVRRRRRRSAAVRRGTTIDGARPSPRPRPPSDWTIVSTWGFNPIVLLVLSLPSQVRVCSLTFGGPISLLLSLSLSSLTPPLVVRSGGRMRSTGLVVTQLRDDPG